MNSKRQASKISMMDNPSFQFYPLSSMPELLKNLFLTIIFTCLLSYISITLSVAYFKVGAFHNDSASYLLQALAAYDVFSSREFMSALYYSLHVKDGLDVLLRMMFIPSSFNMLYGHMFVAIPFMALFISLLLHYVYTRTESWFSAIVAVMFLFTFSFAFSPFKGIADYWKESIAVWMLGCAILSWLMADNFSKASWSTLSGLLFGFLVMQRTALAVYVFFLMLPLFGWILYHSIKHHYFQRIFRHIIYFALPLLLLTLTVLIAQWKTLYTYYFVSGYAYGTYFDGMIHFFNFIKNEFLFSTIVMSGLLCYCSFAIADWKVQGKDVASTSWLAMGLPLVIIFSGSFYHSIIIIWPILFTIMLAAFIPRRLKQFITRRHFNIVLVGVIVCAAIYQYSLTDKNSQYLLKYNAKLRKLCDQLTNVVLAQSPPYYASFIFDSIEGHFINHLRYNRKILSDSPNNIKIVGYISTRDSYFAAFDPKGNSANITGEMIAQKVIKTLETNEGTIVATYCDPNAIDTSPAFINYGKKVANPYAKALTQHLMDNLHWKVIAKITDPTYGCLYAYQFSNVPSTLTSKWSDIKLME